MSITHASIVPLIGGETLGAEAAFGVKPEYFMSYTPFKDNDQHILNYYNNEIPYYVLDAGGKPPAHRVDVIGSVCPCAGLSQMSHGFGDDNPNNKWLPETTKYVLNESKPQVFWGENAPGFAGKIGATVRNEMFNIAKDAGYTMSVYRTRSLLHGVPQVRERSFFFFWDLGTKQIPLFNYYNRPRKTIEQTILDAKGNTLQEPINPKTPSVDDPYYRFILEHIHGGISHAEFCKIVEPTRARGNDVLTYIEKKGYDYSEVGAWMAENGYDREVPKCQYRKDKIAAGGNLMRRGTVIPRDYIGAFVGHYPTSLTHPVYDRYITYREALTIMGHPDNFELLGPLKKNYNHICQNVPVSTATDMAAEIREVLAGNREFVTGDYVIQHNNTQTHEIIGGKTSNVLDFFI